jgi:hypothetical protein
LRDKPIHLQHRIIDPTPAIGEQRRWGIWMPTLLQHLKGFFTGFGLILAHTAGDT